MASRSLQVIKYMLIKYFQDSYLSNQFINYFFFQICAILIFETIETDIAKFHEVSYQMP